MNTSPNMTVIKASPRNQTNGAGGGIYMRFGSVRLTNVTRLRQHGKFRRRALPNTTVSGNLTIENTHRVREYRNDGP